MLVPGRRLELPRPLSHWHLKPARLPFRHPGRCRPRGHIRAGAGPVNGGPRGRHDLAAGRGGIAGRKVLGRRSLREMIRTRNRSGINAVAIVSPWAQTRIARQCGSLLRPCLNALSGQGSPARGIAHDRPHRHHLRRVRLHRPPGRPAHGSRRLAGAGGGAPARTRRTSSAPTASSARSSRSRPTSATRPRPAPPSPGPRRWSTASASWPRPASRPSTRWSTRAPARIARISAEEGVAPARPHLGHRRRRRRATASTPPPRAAARRRCAAAFPGAVDPAPVGRLRHRRQLLQPLRRDGAHHAGAAGRRPGDPLPAGLRQGRGRGGRGRRHHRRRARRLRARRPRGRHLPRADAAAARGSSSAGGSLVTLPFWLARHAGLVPRPRPAPDRRPGRQRHPDPRPGAAARPRQRRRRRGARGLADLGVTPTAMDAILETYLYAYRPHGQFDAITDARRTCGT